MDRQRPARIAQLFACSVGLIVVANGVADEISTDPLPRSEGINVAASGDRIEVTEHGTPVLRYQLAETSRDGAYPRSNYIHPLYDLDGAILTEDFPADHPWHRGVFWTWHQVILGDKRIGDPWICEDFQWEVVQVESAPEPDGSCRIRVQLHWKSPDWTAGGSARPFAQEIVELRVYPKSDDARVIDFEIQLLALTPDLQIGGSENAKGYGGFSLRIKNPLELRFRGAAGMVHADRYPVRPGRWLEISNRNDEIHNRIVVLTHKDHPGGVAPWVLRNHTKAMQNVVYPGRHPVSVSDDPDSPLSLRYRLIIIRDEAAPERIAGWLSEYDGQSQPGLDETP